MKIFLTILYIIDLAIEVVNAHYDNYDVATYFLCFAILMYLIQKDYD